MPLFNKGGVHRLTLESQQKTGISYSKANKAITKLLQIIKDNLKKGKTIQTPMGDFYLIHVKGKRYINGLGFLITNPKHPKRIKFAFKKKFKEM